MMTVLPLYSVDHPHFEALLEQMSASPEQFLAPHAESYRHVSQALPILFRLIKQLEEYPGQLGAMDELLVDGFDTEQVWAQIQALNTKLFETQLWPQIEELTEHMEEAEEEDQSDAEEKDDEMDVSDEEKSDPSNAEDEGMEAALEDQLDPKDPFGFHAEDDEHRSDTNSDLEEEEEEGDDSEEENDNDENEEYAEGVDEEAAQCMYEDFFGKAPPKESDLEATVDALDQDGEPLSAKVSNLFLDDDTDDDLDESEDVRSEPKADERSTFEQDAERMQQEIDALEREAVKEKQWALKGEVTAKHRPLNSLLEEVVEFDCVRQPVPVVSETYTRTLEEIIKQRVLAEQFDDVRATVRADAPLFVPTPTEALDGPSKVSLADLYEQEYMDQMRGSKPSAVVEALTEQHREINALEQTLFATLDALSNFFYTPRVVAPVATTPADIPALQVEEAIPAHVSDAATKAPAEIFKPSKQIKGESELTSEEKTRLRKKAKADLRSKRDRKEKQKELLNQSKPNPTSEPSTRSVSKLLRKKNVTVLNDENRDLKKRKVTNMTGAQLRL